MYPVQSVTHLSGWTRAGFGLRYADGCGCRMGDFDRLRALASLHGVRFCTGPLADTCRRGVAFSVGNSGRGSPPTIGESGVASLVYVGPVATAFAYWAVVEAGRHFRASTMSMTLLAAPSLGILISALTLGEPIGASLIAGVVLTGTGIRLATSATQGGQVEPSAVREN